MEKEIIEHNKLSKAIRTEIEKGLASAWVLRKEFNTDYIASKEKDENGRLVVGYQNFGMPSSASGVQQFWAEKFNERGKAHTDIEHQTKYRLDSAKNIGINVATYENEGDDELAYKTGEDFFCLQDGNLVSRAQSRIGASWPWNKDPQTVSMVGELPFDKNGDFYLGVLDARIRPSPATFLSCDLLVQAENEKRTVALKNVQAVNGGIIKTAASHGIIIPDNFSFQDLGKG